MRSVAFPLVALAALAAVPVPGAPAALRPSLPCVATRIAKIAMPSGPARYQGGRLTLENGAVLELSGPLKSADMYRVSAMHAGDRVAACYGPLTTYADAGPSRTITVLDQRNGQYYGTLVGTWSGRNAQATSTAPHRTLR
ncbi:MAG: hypothetical protein GIW94_06920 [Candidatus Eremiobacteraeota bacterium]|nr:hypothetical protein [Candidatus Eremiobacteraeota bacterium]MBC5821756.1 hypothetical protein [Candidatus Eremiobacteraeota bacterium]